MQKEVQSKGNISSVILDRIPGSEPLGGLRDGSKAIIYFSEYCHVAYQIKGNDASNNMVANILLADPPPPPDLGVGKGQNSTFSEHGHVAYHIKGNTNAANMVANILPQTPARDPGEWGQNSEYELFQNMVMLHIKLKRMTGAARC